jgi:hypothetical protein
MSILPLHEQLFDSKYERAFFKWWRQFFSLHELESSRTLQWVFGATLLTYFITFDKWFFQDTITKEAFADGLSRCWPYFQSCTEWHILQTLPHGYSQPILYMVLFGLLALAVFLMHKKDWVLAQMVALPLFLWHFLMVFVLTQQYAANYEYFLFLFGFILFFLPHKEFFLKVSLALLYFCAATLKLNDGWLLGTYFSAMKGGLPIFGENMIPVWTNLVILMQIVGVWFLFCKNKLVQRLTLFFFATFHLYSGVLVGYMYPVTVFPTLMILFGAWYRHAETPLDKRAIPGFVLITAMVIIQFTPFMVEGDHRSTLEANKYGLFMFEANHQCDSTAVFTLVDGRTETKHWQTDSARFRCDPYKYFTKMQHICTYNDVPVQSASWTFDHSINGGPFMRIVDEDDACGLEYKPFEHNEWIKIEKDNPEIIGYPVENHYR